MVDILPEHTAGKSLRSESAVYKSTLRAAEDTTSFAVAH